jgi:hypothetical protein
MRGGCDLNGEVEVSLKRLTSCMEIVFTCMRKQRAKRVLGSVVHNESL